VPDFYVFVERISGRKPMRQLGSAVAQVFLVVLFVTPSPQTVKRAAAATAGDPRASCKEARFEVSLRGGDLFSREIGDGLVLRLMPITASAAKGNGGWFIEVTPTNDDKQDYAYPLNPPLRFANSQWLGTGYGIPAREQLSQEHSVRFILSAAEYERIHKFLLCALWPCQTPAPNETAKEYLEMTARAPSGLIEVLPKSVDTSADGTIVNAVRLSIAVIAPRQLDFAPDLTATDRACPAGVAEP